MFFEISAVCRTIWGRLDLTGGVIANVSMQAHRVRALKDSPTT